MHKYECFYSQSFQAVTACENELGSNLSTRPNPTQQIQCILNHRFPIHQLKIVCQNPTRPTVTQSHKCSIYCNLLFA